MSLPVTVCPDMGVMLDWSCNDDFGSGGGDVSLVLIQKYGASTSEGQNVSGEDVGELTVNPCSCKKQREW